MVVFGIDEAHCGVLWGGTFIQEWGYLGSITKALSLSLSLSQWTCGRPPVLLMTATAPPAERSFPKSAFLLRKLQYIQVYPVRVCCDFSISVS